MFAVLESEEMHATKQHQQQAVVNTGFLSGSYQMSSTHKTVAAGAAMNVDEEVFDLTSEDRVDAKKRLIVLGSACAVDMTERTQKALGEKNVEHACGAPLNSGMSDCKGNPLQVLALHAADRLSAGPQRLLLHAP
jgi:hypothetical protein